MPDIESFSYGYDREGVNKYINDIKATALQEASDAVKNIDAIRNCCNENWKGKAKDKPEGVIDGGLAVHQKTPVKVKCEKWFTIHGNALMR